MVLILPLINFPQSFFLAFRDRSKNTRYNLYHRYLDVSQLFRSRARSKYLSIVWLSFIFTLIYTGTVKSISSFLLVNKHNVWSSNQDLVIYLNLEVLGTFYTSVSFSRSDSGLCMYHLSVWSNFTSCIIPISCPVMPVWCICSLTVSSLSAKSQHLLSLVHYQFFVLT